MGNYNQNNREGNCDLNIVKTNKFKFEMNG